MAPGDEEAVIAKVRTFLGWLREWLYSRDTRSDDRVNFTSFAFVNTGETIIADGTHTGYYVTKYDNKLGTNLAKTIDTAAQSLRILAKAGWVHGDVKLRNLVCDNTGRAYIIDLEDPCRLTITEGQPEPRRNPGPVMFSPVSMCPLYVFFRQMTLSHPPRFARCTFEDYKFFHSKIYHGCAQGMYRCKEFEELVDGILDAAAQDAFGMKYMELVRSLFTGDKQAMMPFLLHSDLLSLGMSCVLEAVTLLARGKELESIAAAVTGFAHARFAQPGEKGKRTSQTLYDGTATKRRRSSPQITGDNSAEQYLELGLDLVSEYFQAAATIRQKGGAVATMLRTAAQQGVTGARAVQHRGARIPVAMVAPGRSRAAPVTTRPSSAAVSSSAQPPLRAAARTLLPTAWGEDRAQQAQAAQRTEQRQARAPRQVDIAQFLSMFGGASAMLRLDDRDGSFVYEVSGCAMPSDATTFQLGGSR